MKTDTITKIKSALDAIWQEGDFMAQKELQVGYELEFNGKTYRVEPEVEKCTCIGCDLYDDGERLCGDRFPCGDRFILKEIKEMTRHIELGVVKVEGNKVTFKIIEQTHRNEDFCQQTELDIFKASNEIVLKSRNAPEWRGNNSTLFCRGYILGKDNIEIVCTTSEFARISEAVNEYNITDGKGYENLWPKNGDMYFYVYSNGIVETARFDEVEFDISHKNCGNFFRTEEEAVAAAGKVKTLFKKIAERVK